MLSTPQLWWSRGWQRDSLGGRGLSGHTWQGWIRRSNSDWRRFFCARGVASAFRVRSGCDFEIAFIIWSLQRRVDRAGNYRDIDVRFADPIVISAAVPDEPPQIRHGQFSARKSGLSKIFQITPNRFYALQKSVCSAPAVLPQIRRFLAHIVCRLLRKANFHQAALPRTICSTWAITSSMSSDCPLSNCSRPAATFKISAPSPAR